MTGLWDKRKQKTATWAVFKTVFMPAATVQRTDGSETGFILATTYSSVAEAKVPSAIRGFPVWFGMEQRVTPAL